jgi:hypothetical protein
MKYHGTLRKEVYIESENLHYHPIKVDTLVWLSDNNLFISGKGDIMEMPTILHDEAESCQV